MSASAKVSGPPKFPSVCVCVCCGGVSYHNQVMVVELNLWYKLCTSCG